DVYTNVVDKALFAARLPRHKLTTTFINSLPGAKRRLAFYLPLMPLALEQLDLRGYDLVISSESAPAKNLVLQEDCLHICYCHSPMRYCWNMYADYLRELPAFLRAPMRVAAH